MILLSLLLHCDIISCVNYEKINFNEDLLMKQHNLNSFQIKAFIKEAQHRFHDVTLATEYGDNHDRARADRALDAKNANWWWDNSSFIEQLDQHTPKTFRFPHIRSRPSFPYSMTPYTTESNDQHLNWDEIFPEKLRSGSEIFFTQISRSLSESTSNPEVQNSPDSMSQSSKSHISSRSLLLNTTPRPESPLRARLDHGFTSNLLTPNKYYMKWLHEITTFTQVDRWLRTLAGRTGVTRSYSTNSTSKVSGTLPKAKTTLQPKQLKNQSTDQPPRLLRLGHPQPHSSAGNEDYSVPPTTTSVKFQIVNVSGIVHLRTVTMKDERRTDGNPGTPADQADAERTLTTAGDVVHRGQGPNTPETSSKKSRRFHSKARKSKRYHRSRQRKKKRQKHLKYSDDDNNDKRPVEYPMLRRRRITTGVQRRFSVVTPRLKGKKKPKTRGFFSNPVTRPFKNFRAKYREPAYRPTATSHYLSELDDPEDDKHMKLIPAQDRLQHGLTAQKDKPFIYHQVQKNLKEKDISRNRKAELIRNIVEGSSYSYSDEEAILWKNFIGALRYRNRT